jgi:hypothetical protein
VALCSFEGPGRRGLSSFSGGFSEGETPLPIPNRAVKPLSADGTWPARAWESRTPPVFLDDGPPMWRPVIVKPPDTTEDLPQRGVITRRALLLCHLPPYRPALVRRRGPGYGGNAYMYVRVGLAWPAMCEATV